MIYTYKCDECNYIEDFEYGVNEEKPKRNKCPCCKEMSMHRIFDSAAIHIPFQWTKDQFRFDKRPRQNRKYR